MGEYTWKLLATNGLRAEFITQIGQNVDPSWERATGNHEAPIGAAIDAQGLYRVGATNEGGHYAVKTDLEGKHLWAIDRYAADPWAQGTVAVTLVNGRPWRTFVPHDRKQPARARSWSWKRIWNGRIRRIEGVRKSSFG